MTQTAEALKTFFSGFGLPAYMSGNIPDNVKMPYITYELIEPEPLAFGLLHASVWYRATNVEEISAKVDEIRRAVGNGLGLPTKSGAVHLFKEKSGAFAQIINDPDRETKRAYLSFIIHCNTN